MKQNTLQTAKQQSFHEDPSNNSDILAILPKGEVLSYEKNVQNGYSKVVYNGTTGYVLSTYLSTEKPAEQAPTQQPQKTADPTPVVVNTNNYNQKLAKKEYFLNKANGIERYENDYLDTAMSQHDMNVESGNVYKKWDALLNEVYQYLKTILPASEFKSLQQDEYRWVEQKERSIEEAGAEWAGGFRRTTCTKQRRHKRNKGQMLLSDIIN